MSELFAFDPEQLRKLSQQLSPNSLNNLKSQLNSPEQPSKVRTCMDEIPEDTLQELHKVGRVVQGNIMMPIPTGEVAVSAYASKVMSLDYPYENRGILRELKRRLWNTPAGKDEDLAQLAICPGGGDEYFKAPKGVGDNHFCVAPHGSKVAFIISTPAQPVDGWYYGPESFTYEIDYIYAVTIRLNGETVVCGERNDKGEIHEVFTPVHLRFDDETKRQCLIIESINLKAASGTSAATKQDIFFTAPEADATEVSNAHGLVEVCVWSVALQGEKKTNGLLASFESTPPVTMSMGKSFGLGAGEFDFGKEQKSKMITTRILDKQLIGHSSFYFAGVER